MFGSLIFLGIGGILFLMVMTVSLARYIFYALPPIHLAPTLWVGIAPTSILTIIILRLNTPLQAYLSFSDPTAETLHVIAKISGTGLWGFALFWLFLAAIVTLELHRTNPLPFALSWWAFVFPVGAFTVASGVLYQAMPVAFFLWTGLASFVVLVAFWLIIFSHTLRGIWQGSIFIPHSSK
jgi:tellurite resistance protein TehA-like permease